MLQLGNRMRDAITGFTGIAITRTDFMTGNCQFALQPPMVDGKEIEAKSFDIEQLDFVDEGFIARVVPAPEDTGITLGQKVKDIVMDVDGIATLKTTFLNGCVYYTVVTKEITGDKPVQNSTFFVEYRRLTKVSEGILATIRKKLASTTTPGEKPTGGPSFKVPMRG